MLTDLHGHSQGEAFSNLDNQAREEQNIVLTSQVCVMFTLCSELRTPTHPTVSTTAAVPGAVVAGPSEPEHEPELEEEEVCCFDAVIR